jgi:hypothetical protein
VVERYLSSRGLTLPDDVADSVVRFHPRLKYNGLVVSGMVALFRDIETNAPCGIQRTFLDAAGVKTKRAMLGRAKQAALKIDADQAAHAGLGRYRTGNAASTVASAPARPAGRRTADTATATGPAKLSRSANSFDRWSRALWWIGHEQI